MIRLIQQRRKTRGSNAIELFFSLGPILFMTLAFTQFYFLGTGVYFAIQRGYAKAFKDAYAADHTKDTNDKLGNVNMTASIFVLPMFRPIMGNSSTKTWNPAGESSMGSNGRYRIAGGTQADWWEVWDPAIGMIGLVEQYIDFPWGNINIGSLAPYNPGSYTFDTGAMANAAEDAKEDGEQAAQDAADEACEDMADKLSDQIAFRNRANACRNPAIYQQMSGPGGPLYYEKGDEGPGEDLYYMVNPPGEDDPDPSDLTPAYPAAYYTCSEDDYQDDGGNEYGYNSAAAAQADYNKGVAAITKTQQMMAQLGC